MIFCLKVIGHPYFFTETFKPVAAKPDPAILAQRKVYIQWRKGPKLHFVVGGYAYILPWTSVVLRCPTRHFRKGHVRWLKDGKPLALLPHVSISHMGYIKIQQVRASDVGMYTCVAGQAQDNFVLKLIGGKQKVSVPEADFWLTDGSPKTYEMSSISEEKAKEVLSFNHYDVVVQHLLDLKDFHPEGHVSKELLDSAEKNGSILEEDTVLDPQSPQVLVADMSKLDEVTLNLSGGLQGPQKDELISQLFEELTKNTGENNESTLEPNDRQEFSTQGYISQRTGLQLASHSTRQWRGHLRSPAIIQKPLKGYKFPNEIVAHVGSLVLVPRQSIIVELRCHAQGNPKPVIDWTKDGIDLTNTSR